MDRLRDGYKSPAGFCGIEMEARVAVFYSLVLGVWALFVLEARLT